MNKIVIKTVPKKMIRNKSVGDYRKTKNGLEILVAKLGNKDAELEVAIHELVESTLLQKKKVPFKKVTAWDKKHVNAPGEQGEIKGAPYFKEHAVANKIEKILAKELKKRQ